MFVCVKGNKVPLNLFYQCADHYGGKTVVVGKEASAHFHLVQSWHEEVLINFLSAYHFV